MEAGVGWWWWGATRADERVAPNPLSLQQKCAVKGWRKLERKRGREKVGSCERLFLASAAVQRGGCHCCPKWHESMLCVCCQIVVHPLHLLGRPYTTVVYNEAWRAHLDHLAQVGDEDEDVHPLLPDHPPEEVERAGRWAGCGDVGTGLLEAVDVAGVDVVAPLLSGQGAQLDARAIICIVKKKVFLLTMGKKWH